MFKKILLTVFVLFSNFIFCENNSIPSNGIIFKNLGLNQNPQGNISQEVLEKNNLEKIKALKRKIDIYSLQIIDRRSEKSIDRTLAQLKVNKGIYNFDTMLFPVQEYIYNKYKKSGETIKTEPIIDLSREVLGQVTDYINNYANKFKPNLKTANELIDKLRDAEINSDDANDLELLSYLKDKVIEMADYVFSLRN